MWLSSRRPWPPLPACSTSGVLGRRGCALESAAARICREAGARVSTNIFVRDLDLAPLGGVDGRRLEVVAEGLPVFHGAQLAIDTTLVSPLCTDGVPHRQCATSDGAALLQPARRRKERTYPELSGTQGRARLVVFAAEVVADGQRKCVASSVSLPAPRSGHCPSSSVLALSSPGTSVGGPFSLVLPRELQHLHSSRAAGVQARMVRRHPSPTSCVVGVTCPSRWGDLHEAVLGLVVSEFLTFTLFCDVSSLSLSQKKKNKF